jgi:hypothetical protein
LNKLGGVRWYVLQGSGGPTRVAISNLRNASCGEDVLDAFVYRAGELVAQGATTSGCEAMQFDTVSGGVYVVTVSTVDGAEEVSGWDTTVSP